MDALDYRYLATLVRRAQTGDSNAFAELYVATYQPGANGSYIEISEEQTFQEGLDIRGRTSFFRGFGGTRFSPGVHASLGLAFDVAKTRTKVQSINVDVKAECFPLGVSIMDSERNKRLFITFMLSYNWGSRFNKY